MPTINGKACVVDGAPVDKVFSNGRQVYGRNMIYDSGFESGNTPANYRWGDGGHDGRNFGAYGKAETFPSPMGKYMLQVGNYSTDPALPQNQYAYYPITPVIIKAGETWTYSYYYASAGSASGQASDYLLSDLGDRSPIFGLSMGHDLRDTSGGQTTWHFFSKTWTAGADVNVAYLRFGFVKTRATVGGWICIDNIKLAKEPTATPWTPAPEDVM